MSNSGDQYSDTARQIVKEAREERSSYVARCKTMTAEQFLAEPVERRRRLTPEEQIEIAMAIAGCKPAASTGGQVATTAVATPKTRSFFSGLLRRWKKSSDTRKAVIVAVAVGVLVSPVFPLLAAAGVLHPSVSHRPGVSMTNGETWPRCNRLEPRDDRCVYQTTAAHYWPYIADQLGQDADTLKHNNTHIDTDYVPAGALVIINRSAR